MPPVIISKGPTALNIYCNTDGHFAETPTLSVLPWIRQYLIETEWDARTKRSVQKYHYYKYDRQTGILHLPVYMLDYLKVYLNQYHAQFEVVDAPVNPSIDISIDETGNFSDRDYQAEAIQFLINPERSMRALDLQTGSGKTYIAIRALSELKKRALVIVPASIIQQWDDALNSMIVANIDVLRGCKSVNQIIANNYDIRSDIILASINTLSEYANSAGTYNVGPPLREFLRRLQIGVKVVDECHLNFFANVMIDIQSDIEHNLYLSATHMRSAKSSNRIFKFIYPEEIRREPDEYNKYVNITECRFSVGSMHKKHVSTARGWAQFKYEKMMYRDFKRISSFLDRILLRIVEERFISVKRDGQKLLMIVGLREFAEFLVDWFSQTYPDLKSIAYLHETSDDELEKADIIVSTLGSAGTGKDIKNLRTMLLFNSFSSEGLTMQTLGRLRKLANGDTPEFVYFVNTALIACIRHADARRPIYRNVAKKFDIVDY